NLTKIYDNGTRALDNVSFEVKDGEFLAIIGLSGSGKSTLLRCINRLVEPTSGEIWLDGVNVTAVSKSELRAIRRKIGMVFQQFNLVNYFSAQDRQLAMEALVRVGIADKARNRADELSGGQQQRVGIARALV